MSAKSFYLDDFLDEGTPGDLDGWAQFMSGAWGQKPMAKDGDVFRATETTWHYIAAPRKADGSYDVPACPPGLTYHAVAFGRGMGWDGDLMVSSRDPELVQLLVAEDRDAAPEEDMEDSRRQIARILAEYGTDNPEWVVFQGQERKLQVVFYGDPARFSEVTPQ